MPQHKIDCQMACFKVIGRQYQESCCLQQDCNSACHKTLQLKNGNLLID